MASIKNAKKILSIFRENGFEAYIVGGAVRDYIMGFESNDIDITTNARPRDTMRIFDKVLTTGIKYGSLAYHLGLHVPGKCHLVVNREKEEEVNGKVIIFDSIYLHSAYNKSKKDRCILYIDFEID